MAAVPKRKQSKARRSRRRTHQKIEETNVVKLPNKKIIGRKFSAKERN